MTTPLLLVDDSATEWALAAQLVAKIYSWQLVSQVVQKRHFGEQETRWDNHFKRWKVFASLLISCGESMSAFWRPKVKIVIFLSMKRRNCFGFSVILAQIWGVQTTVFKNLCIKRRKIKQINVMLKGFFASWKLKYLLTGKNFVDEAILAPLSR